MDSLKEKWIRLHLNNRYCPVYPSEAVIRWVFGKFPRNEAKRVSLLDLGCGAGRHVLFFASEGYRAYGSDFSGKGVQVAQKRAKEKELNADIRVGEADSIDFPDSYFDGVLCYGVLYYLPFDRYQAAVSEIHRVLRPGGKALVLTRTTSDSRFQLAKKVAEKTYVLAGVPEAIRAEDGMTMTFLDKSDVLEAFAEFSQVSIDRVSVTSRNGEFLDDDWLIELVK